MSELSTNQLLELYDFLKTNSNAELVSSELMFRARTKEKYRMKNK